MTDEAIQSLRRREPILWINPRLRPAGGIIESALVPAPALQAALGAQFRQAGLRGLRVEMVSDRHWDVVGRLP